MNSTPLMLKQLHDIIAPKTILSATPLSGDFSTHMTKSPVDKFPPMKI